MRQIVDELFGANSDKRWHIIYRSIFYTFLAASVSLVFGVSPGITSYIAAAVAVVSYYGQISHVAAGSGKTRNALVVSPLRILPVAAYAIVSISVLVIALRFPASVDAAVVKWRIASVGKNLGGANGASGQSLSTLTSAMTAAHEREIRIRPAVETELKDSLAAASGLNLPGYLPAAGAFINYQSPGIAPGLPDCLQTVPEHLTWEAYGPRPSGPNPPAYNPPPDQIRFTRCQLMLDSPTFAQRFQPATQTDAVSLVCESCEIAYDGGELPIARVKGFVNLIFTNCAFTVHLRDESPVEAKGLVAAILKAPDTNNVNYIAAGYVSSTGEIRLRPDS